MTGKSSAVTTVSSASLPEWLSSSARSRNERQQQLRYPQAQLQTGSLQLGCFDNAPVVRLAFNHRIGSNRTSTLSYRFDDNPGRDAPARFLQTYSTAVIEDPKEVARFVEQLRASGTLYVRVMSHVAGTSTVEFPLKGAPMAIDAAYQTCPVDSLSKPRTAAASARDRGIPFQPDTRFASVRVERIASAIRVLGQALRECCVTAPKLIFSRESETP